MSHGWILDVLEDMRSYCQLNGLRHLAGELEHVLPVARQEIAPGGLDDLRPDLAAALRRAPRG